MLERDGCIYSWRWWNASHTPGHKDSECILIELRCLCLCLPIDPDLLRFGACDALPGLYASGREHVLVAVIITL